MFQHPQYFTKPKDTLYVSTWSKNSKQHFVYFYLLIANVNLIAKYSNEHFVLFAFTKPRVTLYFSTRSYLHAKNNDFIYSSLNLKTLCMFQHPQYMLLDLKTFGMSQHSQNTQNSIFLFLFTKPTRST